MEHLKSELTAQYQVEAEGWLKGKLKAWTSKYPFYKFTEQDVPPGLYASYYPDGQLQQVVCGSTTLTLQPGQAAGKLDNGAWTEEYHADGTWEAWGGLVDRDREQAGQTFQQWARKALEQLSGGIRR